MAEARKSETERCLDDGAAPTLGGPGGTGSGFASTAVVRGCPAGGQPLVVVRVTLSQWEFRGGFWIDNGGCCPTACCAQVLDVGENGVG